MHSFFVNGAGEPVWIWLLIGVAVYLFTLAQDHLDRRRDRLGRRIGGEFPSVPNPSIFTDTEDRATVRFTQE